MGGVPAGNVGGANVAPVSDVAASDAVADSAAEKVTVSDAVDGE